jgi:chemotaxis protein histidine kinase CheA
MDKEILDLYFEEAFEIIDQLEKEFESINKAGITEKTAEEIRRLMHTVKGSSRMIELEDIAILAQEVEQDIKNLSLNEITKEKIEKYHNNYLEIKKKINELKNA